jgi:hypothetical protein
MLNSLIYRPDKLLANVMLTVVLPTFEFLRQGRDSTGTSQYRDKNQFWAKIGVLLFATPDRTSYFIRLRVYS